MFASNRPQCGWKVKVELGREGVRTERKNIQQFVPRAVDLTRMMEAYTRDKRKENLL